MAMGKAVPSWRKLLKGWSLYPGKKRNSLEGQKQMQGFCPQESHRWTLNKYSDWPYIWLVTYCIRSVIIWGLLMRQCHLKHMLVLYPSNLVLMVQCTLNSADVRFCIWCLCINLLLLFVAFFRPILNHECLFAGCSMNYVSTIFFPRFFSDHVPKFTTVSSQQFMEQGTIKISSQLFFMATRGL